jgi:two-component system, OmpR family, response regulator
VARVAHHVLVVDDDPSIRLLCRVNLELEGWRIGEAASLAEAREQLRDVDVILLDVHVGTEDGLAFLDEVRDSRPGTRVAMLTGAADSPTLDEVQVDAVIPKPFTLDQLLGTVRALAEGRRIESPRS